MALEKQIRNSLSLKFGVLNKSYPKADPIYLIIIIVSRHLSRSDRRSSTSGLRITSGSGDTRLGDPARPGTRDAGPGPGDSGLGLDDDGLAPAWLAWRLHARVLPRLWLLQLLHAASVPWWCQWLLKQRQKLIQQSIKSSPIKGFISRLPLVNRTINTVTK